MKTRNPLVLVLVLISLFAGFAPRSIQAAEGVTLDFFYDSLDPLGEWFDVPDYGYCWHPSGVDQNWAPYTDGYWAYTDAGWTWVSYEDWGGITYHYGRWIRVNDLGWCWVPGYEWGPAWVSWRSNDNYIGWAPLPPEVVYSDEFGITVDATYCVGPGYYNFCRFSDFGSPALRPCILSRNQNIVIINNTINITSITFNPHKHIIFNGGPDFALAQGRSTRPIQTLKLVRQTNPNANRNSLFVKQHGNQLDVLAPLVHPPVTGERARPKNIGVTASATGVDRGWNHVSESQMKQLKYQPGNQPPVVGRGRQVGESDGADRIKAPTPSAVNANQGRHNQVTGTPVPSVSTPPVRGENQGRHNQVTGTPVPSVSTPPVRNENQVRHNQPQVTPVPTVTRPPARDEIVSSPRRTTPPPERVQPTTPPVRSIPRNEAPVEPPDQRQQRQPEVSRPTPPPHVSEENRQQPQGRHESRPATSGTGNPAH